MGFLDSLLGHAALTLLALAAILALRDARGIEQGRLFAALALSVSGQQLAGLADVDQIPWGVQCLARIVGVPNVGLAWWFCLSLLRDGRRRSAADWLGMAALSLAPLSYFLEWLGLSTPYRSGISAYGSLAPLAMVGQVTWVALRGRGADLVEPRRRARVWLVVGCLTALVISLVTEEMTNHLAASLIRNAVLGVGLMVPILLWLVQFNPERFRFEPAVPAPPPATPSVDPRDAALHRRLLEVIERDRGYRTQGLTIDQLAETLRAPVSQVRSLIHTGLGYRNFAAFLNSYRLTHAKALLADPERARDTVLAIAHEAGFASLATFNRVFRDLEGRTPSEFREASLARPPLNS